MQGSIQVQEDKPLFFLAIDQSPYAVAKTLVIWEMIRQTPLACDSRTEHHLVQLEDDHLRKVAQAWFSATWENGTRECVRSAIASIERTDNPTVQTILDYWQNAPACHLSRSHNELSEARALAAGNFSAAPHLRRKMDRVAMLNYELTRGFCLLNDNPVSSNILMFDCPNVCPPLGPFESVFSCIPIDAIISNLHSDSRQTVVQAAERYVLDGLSKLARAAADKQVVMESICTKFEDVIPIVRSLNPRTMSWSNICDYIDYRQFHRMVRDCSDGRSTLHFGYSMNWRDEVFGTNIMDFPGPEHVDYRIEIMERSFEMAKLKSELHKWGEYLRCPPPEGVEVTTSQYCLDWLHYETWANFFFDCATSVGCPCNVEELEYGVYSSPFNNFGPFTVAFSWRYM
ncbi:hypothetical protein ACA910_008702 [Epithemia clementina (nom. ined.)]